jgi:hypothetical protein
MVSPAGRSRRLAPAAALFALAAAALSSCTVSVEDGPQPLPPGPIACTREYNPVCGRQGDDRETFSNPCLARAAGYRIIHPGECRRDRPEPEEPQFCTREYDPVCGRRRGDERTFPNECEADAAGYRVIADEPC